MHKKIRHRPMALKDGQSAKECKSTTLEPPMEKGNQLTVKSKYAGRKPVNTPTEQPLSEDTHMQNRGAKPIPARRCLDFTGANQQESRYLLTRSQVREIPTVPGDVGSLLWIPPSEHRASCPLEQQRNLDIHVRYKHIKYSKLCAPALKRLQIDQVSQMNNIPIDKNLIHALIERWREETNSFHMPMGEMTVTLQDVSCLWGLPVKGKPVTGRSEDWMCRVPRLLGVSIAEIQHGSSYYHINLTRLREKFKRMPNNERDPYTDHYTRAFALDLFGSVIFPDGTRNKVSAMYLQFLEDLDGKETYNFGAASLALLYRELCEAARAQSPTFIAPVQLLMVWSWTRVDIGRPVVGVQEEIEWGEPDPESCAAYGSRWNTSTTMDLPVSDYRIKINQMDDSLVTWTPYASVMSRMPTHVQNSGDIWLAGLPVIHFWFVEQHNPGRVMRQFGLFQTTPPPVPLQKHEIEKRHKFNHIPNKPKDWSQVHKEYVDKWSDFESCTISRLDDPSTHDDYLHWFQKFGMYTVDFSVSQINALIDQMHSTDSSQYIGKKRHHSATNNPHISLQSNFQHSNDEWPQYNDPIHTSTSTSYFTETCKKMRLEDSRNCLNGAGKLCSSPASNRNTNEVPAINSEDCTMVEFLEVPAINSEDCTVVEFLEVPAINSGDCTMVEFQSLTAPEASPSRFCQQMVGGMVQQHNKATVRNPWGTYLFASPETQLQHTPSKAEVMGHPRKEDETPSRVYSRKKRKEHAETDGNPKHIGAKRENVDPIKCISSNVVNIESISCGSEPSARVTPETIAFELETDGGKTSSILENSEHDEALKGNVKNNLSRAKVNNAEGMDTDKEKWFGEEQIRSCVDKIRKVQGNRSFSPWKGSVLDSMVGVLLTQNVADHLSSYAFMELAARFPVKSECPDKPAAEISCTRREQKDSCSSLFGNPVKLQGTRTMQMGSEKLWNQHAHSGVSQGVASDPIGLSEETRKGPSEISTGESLRKKRRGWPKKKAQPKKKDRDWDNLRKQVLHNEGDKLRSDNADDSVDWEAVRQATISELSQTIKVRGMQKVQSYRLQEFLSRLVRDHGSTDLEWLRYLPPHEAKEFILSFRGFGLKSAECVLLLKLHHAAFPVDTNVARICVRLGWVPLSPLPESLLLPLLEDYHIVKDIHKYLWARLCKLDQRLLYELHYQMITLGKVFCPKKKPNCNYCPMKGECKHFASAVASEKLALPGSQEKSLVGLEVPNYADIKDIEDLASEDPNEFPKTYLNNKDFIKDSDISKALVSLTAEYPFHPSSSLKDASRARRKRKHQVYELVEGHDLLKGFDTKLPEDPCPYLLYVWTPGETSQSTDTRMALCNSTKEMHAEIVRCTILIPTRTALGGSFPLNGTFFQVNEVFADHDSSQNPIDVERSTIMNLRTRTVHFGTSVPTIFKGLTTEEVTACFLEGFVCVKGYYMTKRAPRPLCLPLGLPASKLATERNREGTKGKRKSTKIH